MVRSPGQKGRFGFCKTVCKRSVYLVAEPLAGSVSRSGRTAFERTARKEEVYLSFLITESRDTLPMETLPAWKITHFYGTPARGCVYAYVRCYVQNGAIPFSVTVFDGAPRKTARIGFAVTPDDTAAMYLFASCAKGQGGTLWLYRAGEEADIPVRQLEMPALRELAGSDEQGVYWSAEGVLPAAALRAVFGRVPKTGDLLPANAFLYDTAEPAFGAACPVPEGCTVPTASGFGALVVVPY